MRLWSVICGWFGFGPGAQRPVLPDAAALASAGDDEDQAWDASREHHATNAVPEDPGVFAPEEAWWRCGPHAVHESSRLVLQDAADQSLFNELKAFVEDPKIELPHLPHIPQRVLTLLRQSHVNYPAIAAVVSQDQTLSAGVLSMANTAAYGQAISNLEVALSRLGMRNIQSLMLKESVKAITIRRTSGGRSIAERLWQKSVASAVTMEQLARGCGIQPDEAFVAGLLHDIGEMVLLRLAFDYQRITQQKVPQQVLEYLWQEAHEPMGGTLARHWNLPETLQQLLGNHHGPVASDDPFRAHKLLLQISDMLAGLMGYGSPPKVDLLGSPAARALQFGSIPDHFTMLEDLPERVQRELNLPI